MIPPRSCLLAGQLFPPSSFSVMESAERYTGEIVTSWFAAEDRRLMYSSLSLHAMTTYPIGRANLTVAIHVESSCFEYFITFLIFANIHMVFSFELCFVHGIGAYIICQYHVLCKTWSTWSPPCIRSVETLDFWSPSALFWFNIPSPVSAIVSALIYPGKRWNFASRSNDGSSHTVYRKVTLRHHGVCSLEGFVASWHCFGCQLEASFQRGVVYLNCAG